MQRRVASIVAAFYVESPDIVVDHLDVADFGSEEDTPLSVDVVVAHTFDQIPGVRARGANVFGLGRREAEETERRERHLLLLPLLHQRL